MIFVVPLLVCPTPLLTHLAVAKYGMVLVHLTVVVVLPVSERLVLLGLDEHENRDYGMLLFHCGLYQDAYAYLSAYSTSEVVISFSVSCSSISVFARLP